MPTTNPVLAPGVGDSEWMMASYASLYTDAGQSLGFLGVEEGGGGGRGRGDT